MMLAGGWVLHFYMRSPGSRFYWGSFLVMPKRVFIPQNILSFFSRPPVRCSAVGGARIVSVS